MVKTHPLIIQIVRFLSIGALAFAADYGLYSVMVYTVDHTAIQLPSRDLSYVAASVLSCICGFLISFILNKTWVFKINGNISRQFLRYLVLFAFNLIWTHFTLYLLIHSLLSSAMIAKLVIICMTTIINFIAYKFIVYTA